MAVSTWREGQMPGSGETSPNPVFLAMPTQPDHTSAAAGAARTRSGQDRTVPPGRDVAGDRPAAGPPDRSGDGPRRPGPFPAVPAGRVPAVRAATGVTILPAWRGDGVRRSARRARRRPRTG